MSDVFEAIRAALATAKSPLAGITIDAHVTIAFAIAPSAPTVLGITSIRGESMTALLNTIVFSAPPAAGVSRVATITITTAAGVVEAPLVVDVTLPTATFPSNDTDSASITATDSLGGLTSVPSAPFVAVTSAPVIAPVAPDAPVITGITSVLA